MDGHECIHDDGDKGIRGRPGRGIVMMNADSMSAVYWVQQCHGREG